MLEKLKKLNPSVKLYDVSDKEFAAYGKLLDGFDTAEILKAAQKTEFPAEGSAYSPSVASFEALDISKEVSARLFGTLDTQMGYCYGHNSVLGATEWHYSSELNIATTPLVLILAKISDIRDGKLNSADMKAFFVPQGSVLEIYNTTTHFCPIEVDDGGFGCVVGLPRGTNTPLECEVSDKMLFRKNKWIICHEDNDGLASKGVAVGIYGENYKINY